jgi:two-component system KDP operon response regulator KdpE
MAKRTQSASPDPAGPSEDPVSIPDAHRIKKTRAATKWKGRSRNEGLLGSVEVGPNRIDLDSRVIRTVDRDIRITPMEYCVLKHLAEHRNEPVPHRQLANMLWGVYSGKGVHSLRCFIRSLRKKLEADPAHPKYIITVTGIGYSLQS